MTGRSGHEFIDTSMLNLFRMETETQTAVLNDGLLTLERHPQNAESLEALMRAAHSLKGAARIIQLGTAERLAHVMEDCFVAAQDGRLSITGEHIETLLQGADMLLRLAQTAESARADALTALQPQVEALVAALAAVATPGTTPPPTPPPRQAASPPPAAPKAPPIAAAAASAPAQDTLAPTVSTPAQRLPAPAQNEAVPAQIKPVSMPSLRDVGDRGRVVRVTAENLEGTRSVWVLNFSLLEYSVVLIARVAVVKRKV